MSKSLILDWQKNSLLLARAHGKASKATIDLVALKPFANADAASQTAAEALRAAAQELQAKGEVSVLVARELVEMRTVQIPKMDADELPDVIRFQAQRQFANMTDAWTVDFVMLPNAAGNEMQTALVAALAPAQLNEIESSCLAAGLQVASIGLRPLQIVQMAIESGLVSGSGRAMLVCVTESIADLLILRDGRVLQIRSTKLPYEADQVGTALQGEVRRSLVAAASELENKPIDAMLLIASEARSGALLAALRQTSAANVVAFHPESLLASADLALAESAGSRLVAVAGAMGLNSADRASIVNFKNPKKRPPKKRDSRKWLLIGGAAATLLIASVGWYYSTISSLDNDFALIKDEIDAKKESGENSKKRLAEFASIEQFASASPNWLDELVYISEKIPGSDKLMLENPSFTIGRGGVGVIDVNLKATEMDSISQFGGSLAGGNYKVSPGTTMALPKPDGRYRYRGEAKIEVSGRGWDLSATQKSDNSPVAPATEDSPLSPSIAAPKSDNEGDKMAPQSENGAPAGESSEENKSKSDNTPAVEKNVEDKPAPAQPNS